METRAVSSNGLLTPGNLSDAPAIKDVAEALSVSEAMIVKVSKLLGFSGFRNPRSARWRPTFRSLNRCYRPNSPLMMRRRMW